MDFQTENYQIFLHIFLYLLWWHWKQIYNIVALLASISDVLHRLVSTNLSKKIFMAKECLILVAGREKQLTKNQLWCQNEQKESEKITTWIVHIIRWDLWVKKECPICQLYVRRKITNVEKIFAEKEKNLLPVPWSTVLLWLSLQDWQEYHRYTTDWAVCKLTSVCAWDVLRPGGVQEKLKTRLQSSIISSFYIVTF